MTSEVRRYRLPLPPVCIAEDCDRKPIARGLCRQHYNRWRRHGGRGVQPPPRCVVEWCEAPTLARGLCYTHYQRWRARRLAEQSPSKRGRYRCKQCGRPIVAHEVTELCG